jgi:integrase
LSKELVVSREKAPAVELAEAAEAAADFITSSKAPSTRRGYASGWRLFDAWCTAHGPITALPAAPGTVAAYFSAMATAVPPARLSTIRHRAAAITHWHRQAGAENPCSHPGVQATLAGIARELGSAPVKKMALTADTLARAIRKIPQDLVGLRDRALILIGFAGALRRSELVVLQVDDVTRHPAGIVLAIRRSKTDQAGEGREIAIPHGRKLAPVAALDAWLAAARIANGPLFRAVRGTTVLPSALYDGTVARIIKRRVEAIGLDPVLFAGHSLRHGFCSSAANSGAQLSDIAKHARHGSVETTIGYVQIVDSFSRHPGKKFL